jgi:hypothetical protein
MTSRSAYLINSIKSNLNKEGVVEPARGNTVSVRIVEDDMKKVYISGILFLALLCIMAPAVATVHTFGASNGASGYQGEVVIDGNGNIAFTIVAAVNGDYTATQDTSPDVSAEQQATANGQAVFAGSGAANTDGDYASTGDMALGGGSIVTDQGAEASCFGAAAGQEDTTVSGDMVLAGSNAGGDDGQYAESVAVVDDGSIDITVQGANDYRDVEAGQIVSATGEDIYLDSYAVDGRSEAEAVTIANTEEGTSQAEVCQGAEASRHSASANQDAAVTGDEVFIASYASGFSSANAVTSVTGAEDPVEVIGQEAEVNFFKAEAEQESVDASGTEVCISTYAEKDGKAAGSSTEVTNGEAAVRDQEAEVFLFGGAEAHQNTSALTSETVHMHTYVSTEFGSSAETCTEVTNGTVGGEQEAEWFFGATASQDMIANAETADLTTKATNGGDEAGTHAGVTEGTIIALQEAEAALFEGASAEQNAFVAGTGGGADSWANAADGNSAWTFINFGGYDEDDSTTGILNTNQYAEATGDAYAYQGTEEESDNFVTVVNGHAAAGSGASSDDGDCADTIAEVFYGGDITTDQWAGAGDVYFNPPGPIVGIGADGAAAGQLTEIFATHGGSVESTASSCDESEAGTEAEFHGVGNISTGQGAAAGDVWVFHEGHADGAIAAQWTDMDSTRGGEASSWASTEDPNFATTEAGYHGEGYIDGTFQGAAAGELIAFHEGKAEGAIAIQHTEEISSNVEDGDTVWASSFAKNDRENEAGTRAFALGDGTISETTQGAIAGEGELWGPLDIEVEGAAAGQYTEKIESGIGGGAVTWAEQESEGRRGHESYASTRAMFFGDGEIEGTLQVAGAGEAESRFFESQGAAAFQQTDEIEVDDGVAFTESESSIHSDVNSAETGNKVCGDGGIYETTQGAFAGEFEGFLIEGEGAAAGQITGLIASDDQGSAWSNSNNERENKAGTKTEFDGVGTIAGTTQGAGAGEIESRLFDFEVEGAAAGQNTLFIGSTDGGSARSWANNECENSAQSNSTYTGAGTIVDLEQGAAAGEIEFGHDEIEGAIAGQETTIGTSYGTASAGTSADAEDGMHTQTFTSANGMVVGLSGNQIAAATGGAFAHQDIEASGLIGTYYAETQASSDCEGLIADVMVNATKSLDVEQTAFADGLVFAHQAGTAIASGNNKLASATAWSSNPEDLTREYAFVKASSSKQGKLFFEQTTLAGEEFSFSSQIINMTGKCGNTSSYAEYTGDSTTLYAGVDDTMLAQTSGSGSQWMNVTGHSFAGEGFIFPVDRASAQETKDYVKVGTVNGGGTIASTYGVSNGVAFVNYPNPPFIHQSSVGDPQPPAPFVTGIDYAASTNYRSDSVDGFRASWAGTLPYGP